MMPQFRIIISNHAPHWFWTGRWYLHKFVQEFVHIPATGQRILTATKQEQRMHKQDFPQAS